MLKEKGMGDVLVIGGGIVPQDDIPFLIEKGVKAMFGPGTKISEVADFIMKNIENKGP